MIFGFATSLVYNRSKQQVLAALKKSGRNPKNYTITEE
jgi:hypothetical protein